VELGDLLRIAKRPATLPLFVYQLCVGEQLYTGPASNCHMMKLTIRTCRPSKSLRTQTTAILQVR